MRLVREILSAGEEAKEVAAGEGGVVADGAAEDGVAGFEGIEDGAYGYGTFELEFNFAADTGEGSQVCGQFKADASHGSVWTSTESTAGRSRTMGAQVSPAFAEA